MNEQIKNLEIELTRAQQNAECWKTAFIIAAGNNEKNNAQQHYDLFKNKELAILKSLEDAWKKHCLLVDGHERALVQYKISELRIEINKTTAQGSNLDKLLCVKAQSKIIQEEEKQK